MSRHTLSSSMFSAIVVVALLLIVDFCAGTGVDVAGIVTGRSYVPGHWYWVPGSKETPGHMEYVPPKYFLFVESNGEVAIVSVREAEFTRHSDGSSATYHETIGWSGARYWRRLVH